MSLTAFICATCGTQYEPSQAPPGICPICTDDRQYVGAGGQKSTTLAQINAAHRNIIELVAPCVYAIYSTPSFGIGQRAHLITTPSGNILWDCISNIDESTVDIINHLGGIKAIAVSHPHYFSTIVEWSDAFGQAPVYINRLEESFLGRKSTAIRLWSGGSEVLWDNLTLVQCGGHFPGACVLHDGRGEGALFVGDTIQVAPTLSTVSFMYSYPNMIPLRKSDVLQIDAAVAPLHYKSIYGAFGRYIRDDAKAAMQKSVERYLKIYE